MVILARADRLRLWASELVLEETERNLAGKASHALPELETVRAARLLRLVDPLPELVREVARVVVVKDAPVVAGAVAARIDRLVTYDRKHLLRQAAVIRDAFGIAVVTPDEFLREL
jgi:predicted nucleic acid-binding protein